MSLAQPIAQGRVAQIYPWEERKVLKLAREWVPEEWVNYEYEIAKMVHATGLNVPEPFERTEVEGRPGIVYSHVEGQTMLAHIGAKPLQSLRYARILAKVHTETHAKPGAPGLPDCNEKLKAKILSVEGAPAEIRQMVIDRLNHLPAGDRLLHGDFHPDNIMLSPHQNTLVPVIIDWPDASRGHPLADVARTSILIRAGGLPEQPILRFLVGLFRKAFHMVYLNTYFKHASTPCDDFKKWLVPVTFARLSEDIASERRWLVIEVCKMLKIPAPDNIP